MSTYLIHNTQRADVVQGKYQHISGTQKIQEQLLQKTFEIGPRSFFQTNSTGAELLYDTVRKWITHTGGTLLDLYA